jgi:Zn-dependent protease
MSMDVLRQILISYCGLILLLTFHEVGHAWTAWKCGDDTALKAGRVSLNPIVHLDPIGTVLIPLLTLFLAYNQSAAAGLLVGWAKPVPVNPDNLRRPRLDDILISMAGPAMNILLAILLAGIARASLSAGIQSLAPFCFRFALISLFLCFFNLIPVPPVDGSHVLRVVVGMSRETYARIASFGFVIVILLLQVPGVRNTLIRVTTTAYKIILGWFHLFG